MKSKIKSPYEAMQTAVNIVNDSTHPTNKVAATLVGEGFIRTQTNFWPLNIVEHFSTKTKIGDASSTIHAETACILSAAGKTKGASIFVTDPPCPNCMKNIAEAGITALYIDHKGFTKDFAARRGLHFENMSMRIAEKAGIAIFEVHRKDEALKTIFEPLQDYSPVIDSPPHISALHNPSQWEEVIKACIDKYKGEPFACAIAKNPAGQKFIIATSRHPTLGFTNETAGNLENKYSFTLQPLNRLMMNIAKEGLKLDRDHIYSHTCPTARELINLIGAGFSHIQIGDKTKSRDKHGIQALKQLTEAGVLEI